MPASAPRRCGAVAGLVPWLCLDAEQATATTWPNHGHYANNFRLVPGTAAPTRSGQGAAAHVTFHPGAKAGYYESAAVSGISGAVFPVTVCAVFRDASQGLAHLGVLTQGGLTRATSMAFVSHQGYPATDSWGHIGRRATRRLPSLTPSHVCWVTPSWWKQSSNTAFYVDGKQERSTTFGRIQDSRLSPARWRVGHWSVGRADMSMVGSVYNIKVWTRALSAAQISQEYNNVGRPIQAAADPNFGK